jgi:dTDP-4-amino-4,6-dideoxygalactose transaminase
VKAVLPVHLFGRAAEASELAALARAHGAVVVEDAAQAIGASRLAGAAACLSFFPSKNLGAWGDGGAVLTDDPALAARVRSLRAHGAEGGRPYRHPEIGTNSRLDALQAAVLSVKLRYLDAWTAARARVAARYREALAPLEGRLVVPRPAVADVHNQFVVRTERRDALARALAERGIETKVYYPIALPDQPCFASLGCANDPFPAAREAARTALALPIHAELDDAQIDHVVSAVRAFFAV